MDPPPQMYIRVLNQIYTFPQRRLIEEVIETHLLCNFSFYLDQLELVVMRVIWIAWNRGGAKGGGAGCACGTVDKILSATKETENYQFCL